MASRWPKHFQRWCQSGTTALKSTRPPGCGDPARCRTGRGISENAMKLWTASALAVALQVGMGCQASRPTAIIQASRTGSANHPPDGHPLILSQPLRHWVPGMRIFRGSVSSVSVENDLIAR